MNYFFDESGSTGDLINKKFDLNFFTQPIFTHVAVGIDEKTNIDLILKKIKEKHQVGEGELKSQDVYFKKTELMHDIIKYIVDARLPFLCEVVDKKYTVSTSMVNHLIVPPMRDETDGKNQYIRNKLADFISLNAPDECFKLFFSACMTPTESALLATMNELKLFFNENHEKLGDENLTVVMIDETIDDYQIAKARIGEEEALKQFIPIPDKDSNNNIIAILPHVHCFYNLLARLNKYHCRDLDDVTLYHDTQNEFSETLRFCIENIKSVNMDNIPPIPNADFNIKDEIKLEFTDSKESAAIQIADIIAGFLNRYINGLMYKKADIESVYHKIFDRLLVCNRLPHPSPLGINFVLPESIREEIFSEFMVY
ncbi:DUF3800 domain-containing protein [Enterobacter roggenkampii]